MSFWSAWIVGIAQVLDPAPARPRARTRRPSACPRACSHGGGRPRSRREQRPSPRTCGARRGHSSTRSRAESHLLGVLPALALHTSDAVLYLAAYGLGTVTAMVSFTTLDRYGFPACGARRSRLAPGFDDRFVTRRHRHRRFLALPRRRHAWFQSGPIRRCDPQNGEAMAISLGIGDVRNWALPIPGQREARRAPPSILVPRFPRGRPR